jgi:hypothetical protein
VDGAVAAYGGTSLPPARDPFCSLYTAIAPPTGLEATYDDVTHSVTLTFRRPSPPAIPVFLVPSPWKPRTSFAVSGIGVRCARPGDPAQAPHARWDVQPRGIQKLVFRASAGTSCFSVWAVDSLGRPSDRPGTVRLTIP